MLDRHFRRRVRNWLIGVFGPRIAYWWIRTLRLRYGAGYRGERHPVAPTPGIFLFWHQRILLMAGQFRGSGYAAMISRHSDGEMIARVIEGLGMHPVRGSSGRGGARVVRELLQRSPDEFHVAMTPDGPRGPRHHVHPGAVYLASRTGLPIYPVGIAARRRYELPTWDGFHLPLPFTRAYLQVGEVIRVPPDADRETIETYRQRVEDALREVTERTDRDLDRLWAGGQRLKELPRLPTSRPAPPVRGGERGE